MSKIDRNIINETKILALDMIDKASSGHPGIVLGGADILYALYSEMMTYNPKNPNWLNRDRLIMSSGHGSALLYATLYMAGFPYTLDDLKAFREINSLTPGHPKYNPSLGIEATTGPLGEGIASAVGIALAERYYENLVKKAKPKSKLIDYYTYCYCGDGDLMEGISYEALSFAGCQKLNKLILLYDCNHISLDGKTSLTFTEDIVKRFEAISFNVIKIKKLTKIEELYEAIEDAKSSKKPSIIIINTIIGKDSLLEGTNKVHGSILTKEDLNSIKNKYKHTEEPFTISESLITEYHNHILKRNSKNLQKWKTEYESIYNEKNNELISLIAYLEKKELPINFEDYNIKINEDYYEELRISNHKIMNLIASKTPFFLGGSADLSSSCKTNIDNSDIMSNTNPLGKNIFFGVRENAMGGILNGLAISGLRVFGSTFLTFSDYLKPSLRLSAMMNLPVTYVFTHDSISVGKDGETHEPVEQISSLRLIPNLITFRPCDINEIIGSWDYIIRSQVPSSIIVTKEKTPLFKNTNAKYVKYGAYMIRREKYHLDACLIAAGEEVDLAMDVASEIFKEGIDLRVISMPSMELFLKQNPRYEEQLLPKSVKIFSLEAGNTMIWNRFVTNPECAIGINNFGKSGSKEDLKKEYNLEINKIINKIKDNLDLML